MSSPRRLLLAAAIAAFSAAAGASPAAAISTVPPPNSCGPGVAVDVETISTNGDQPTPARSGTMQLCGRSPLSATAGDATPITVADGSITRNSSYQVNLMGTNLNVPVFNLDVASVDWGDGSTPTYDIPTTGPITAGHAYGPVSTPTNYTLTVKMAATFAPSGLSTVRRNADGFDQITEQITVNPVGTGFTIAPQTPNGDAGWNKTGPVAVHLEATSPDGVKPFSCTDAVGGAGPQAIGATDSTPDGTFPLVREADLSIADEGVHRISCDATTNGDPATTITKTADVKLDTTPPVLTVHDWHAEANSPRGLFMLGYPSDIVSATDNLSGATTSCIPQPVGETLPFGVYRATCGVLDGAGNVGETKSFLLHVMTGGEQLRALALRSLQVVPDARGSWFATQLGYAALQADLGQRAQACSWLVNALSSVQFMPQLRTAAFVDDVRHIDATLGCGLNLVTPSATTQVPAAPTQAQAVLGASLVQQLMAKTGQTLSSPLPRRTLLKIGRTATVKAKKAKRTKKASASKAKHAKRGHRRVTRRR